MNEVEQISVGIIIGVGALIYLVISVALHDRRAREKKEDDPPPK